MTFDDEPTMTETFDDAASPAAAMAETDTVTVEEEAAVGSSPKFPATPTQDPACAAHRLKRMEMDGFKSFGVPTSFDFTRGVTAIVGPNGCGKSNVVDAITWVLGSRSAKQLRGHEMKDLIFAGGAHGKPGRYARVALVFENRDRFFQGVDTDEVEVARSLTRDGSSDYTINGEPARLTDLRNLFLDTGIGVSAYSIIGQMKITAFLEANPTERRSVFEEAAGISRFKAQRKEVLARLEKVQTLLDKHRVKLDGIRGQVRKVKSQAGKAQRYKEYTERLKRLKAVRGVAQYVSLKAEREAQLSEAAGALRDQAAAEGYLEEEQTALEKAEAELETVRQKVQAAMQELHAVETRIAAGEATIKGHEERLADIAGQREMLQQALADMDANEGHYRRQEALTQEKVQVAEGQCAEAQQQVDALDAEVQQLIERRDLVVEEVAAYRRKAAELDRAVSAFSNELTALESDIRLCHDRIGTATRKQTELEYKQKNWEKQRGDLARQVLQLKGTQGEVHNAYQKVLSELEALDEEIDATDKAEQQLRNQATGLEARRDTLRQMLKRTEGLGEGARLLLEDAALRGDLGLVGPLCDAFSVDPANARAVEAALGALSTALVAPDDATAIAALTALAERDLGGADILSTARASALSPVVAPEHASVVGLASDLIEPSQDAVADTLRAVLSQWVVADTLASAEAILSDLADPAAGVVTLDGQVMRAPAVFSARPQAPGLVTLQAELGELEAQHAGVMEHLAERQERLTELRDGRITLRRDVARLKEEEANLRLQIQQREAQSDLLAEELKKVAEELTISAEDVTREENRLKEREEKLLEVREQLAAARKEAEAVGEEVSTREGTAAEVEQALKTQQQELNARQVALAKVENSLDIARQSLAHEAENLKRLTAEREKAQAKLAEQDYREAESREAIGTQRAQMEEQLVRADELTQARDAADKETAFARTKVGAIRGKVEAARGKVNEAVQVLQKAQFEAEASLHQMAAVEQRVREELDLDLQDLLEREGDNPALTDDEGNPLEPETVENEIAELTQSLHRLGNVNMEALSELETLEKQQGFLAEQETDIVKTRNHLAKTLKLLEEQSITRFITTFRAIRDRFQEFFRRLFGGGSADVFLLNEEDPLNSGIEIKARPPGGEPGGLRLLSGGQRTMLTIALLFAIYDTKPSPFTILDEVDAALDEANNGRFAALLTEFAERSQYLVITHKKVTMGAADRLYGITMEEAGITKRVQLNLNNVHVDERGEAIINEDAE